MKPIFLLLTSLLLVPISLAQVQITEIMYNLDGSDENREWIEVKFTEDLNFSDWKFFEANTNHRLNLVQGSDSMSAGDYAVIARKETDFMNDNPSFTGNLFTSSFSLLNTEEPLEIRTPEKETVDSVTYTSAWGADGDGNSLQLLSDWEACEPTPGLENDCPSEEEPEPEPEPEAEEEQEKPEEEVEIEEEEQEEAETDWVPEDLQESEEAVEEETEAVEIQIPQEVVIETASEPELVYSSSAGNIKLSMYALLLLSVFLNIVLIVRR